MKKEIEPKIIHEIFPKEVFQEVFPMLPLTQEYKEFLEENSMYIINWNDYVYWIVFNEHRLSKFEVKLTSQGKEHPLKVARKGKELIKKHMKDYLKKQKKES